MQRPAMTRVNLECFLIIGFKNVKLLVALEIKATVSCQSTNHFQV